MGLLAQSGYSTNANKFRTIIGCSNESSKSIKKSKTNNDLAELGTLGKFKNLYNLKTENYWKADGFQYYADTGERVLHNVKAPVDTSFKEYFSIADGNI